MLFIQISSTHYLTDKFYKFKLDNESNIQFDEEIDDRDIPEIFYDEDHVKFDAYNVEFGMRDEIVCKSITNEHYYQVETDKSVLCLIRDICNFERSCELFDFYRAHQRNKDQYLELRIAYTSGLEFNKFMVQLSQWIYKYGHEVNNRAFQVPAQISEQSDLPHIRIPANGIGRSTPYDTVLNGISWDTEWPVFEGAAGDYIYLAVEILATVSIPVILSYFGLSTREQRNTIKEEKLIKKYCDKIRKLFPIVGMLKCPDTFDFYCDNTYFKIYVYEEYNNNRELIASYHVKFRHNKNNSNIRAKIVKVVEPSK